MKLVSIIMTCHNGERFLDKAVSSIMNQTYESWEIIFIDNNSSDKSKNILLSYDDKRIKYFKLNKTINLGSVRNYALNKCSGEFISFLDVDDIWSKLKLEKQVSKLINEQNIDVLYSNFYELKNSLQNKIKKKLYKGYCKDKIIISYLNNSPLTAWVTLMIRRSAIDKLEYFFDKNLHIISDFDFIIRLSKFSYFDYLDDYLCDYRVHDYNESKKTNKTIFELYYLIKKYKKNTDIYKIFSKNFYAQKIIIKNFFYKLKLFN